MFLRAAVADICVRFVMQFFDRAWSWSSERQQHLPDFEPSLVECSRGVLFPLPQVVIEMVRRVIIR